MVNGNLGIRSKIEPSLDSNSTRRMVSDLEKEIEEVEQLQFESDGFRGRTSPGGGGGGRGGGGVGAGAAGAAASRLGGGALAGGAAMLGTVALGGVLAERMYSAMSNASGRLQAVNGMFGQAMSLFWKPFGDVVADALQPYAKDALKSMIEFNALAKGEGLGVAITDLSSDVQEGWAGAVGDQVNAALEFGGLGDLGVGDSVTNALEDIDWATVIATGGISLGPQVSTGLGEELVGGVLDSLPDIGADDVTGSMTFETIGASLLLSQPMWSPVGSGMILGKIFGDFTIGKSDILGQFFGGSGDSGSSDGSGSTGDGNGGSGGTPGPPTGSPSTDYPGNPDRTPGPPTGSPSTDYPGNPNRTSSQDVNVTLEADGRRLADATNRERNRLFARL